MRLRSKILRTIAFVGATVLMFYLGRFSARVHPAESVPAKSISLSEQKPLPEPKPIVSLVVTSAPNTIASALDWDRRWRESLAKPSNRKRDQEIIAAIEDLATREPTRALSLAEAEPNLRLRLEMYRAALRGWGTVSPESAADWALSGQTAIEKNDAVSAVLAGTIKNPDAAVQLTTRLLQKDPEHSREHGVALIAALTGSGEFEKAARFAATGVENNQQDWLSSAYSMWADHQPKAALNFLSTLSDPQAKRNAFSAVITSWSANEPEAVVKYAATLPAGPDRQLAFTDGLQNWAANDPAAAAAWLNENQSGSEYDAGVASIATSSQLSNNPKVSLSWAETIVDAQIRSRTLGEILQQWASTDPEAVRHYLDQSKDIQGEDRDVLLAFLNR